jgi:hypothetical protein
MSAPVSELRVTFALVTALRAIFFGVTAPFLSRLFPTDFAGSVIAAHPVPPSATDQGDH